MATATIDARPNAIVRALRSARRVLPQGVGLSEETWRGRHRAILVLVWLHAIGVPAFGTIMGRQPHLAALEGGPIALIALIASVPNFGRRLRAAAASTGLLTSSAILVHFSEGLIEMHFHFFVMVPIVALYQDWFPFMIAISYVLVHHGLVGQISPWSVYNHVWGQRNPWRWASVHALFIAGISAVCLVSWRIQEIMLARQHRAEADLMEEKRIVETLHAIGTTLVAELDPNRIAQHVTDEGRKATGAAFGVFFYKTKGSDGEGSLLYSLSGVPRETFDGLPLPRITELLGTTFTGSSVVRLDDVTTDERFGRNAPYHGIPKGHLPVRSYLAVPVHSRSTGEVLGGLFFGHAEPGVFTEHSERMAVGIASQASVAFDNAQLYQAERQAHAAAESARARLTLLAEAGRALVSSLDPETTLRNIARLCVPTLADVCVVDLLDDEGTINRVACLAAPGLEDATQGLADYAPDRDNGRHPVVRVINGGPSEIVDAVTPELVDQATRGEAHREVINRMQGTSSMVVPLTGRGSTFGAISFLTLAVSKRVFGPDDLPLAEELGRRTGIAVENAKLYGRQRSVAETLQHALLPERLPDIPGFEVTPRYIPSGSQERVGGDWYDVFEVPHGEIALAMGDVVGRGIRAAALMAQLRNALRAIASEGESPAGILRKLNQFMHATDTQGMATLAIAVLDPVSGRLRIASAGHPPMLYLPAGGEPRYLSEGLGPPLGVALFARFDEDVIQLHAADTLVLYTDGLVEDRDTPLDTGLARLRDAATSPIDGVAALADHLVNAGLEGRTVDDDVALLVVRSLPVGADLSLRLPARSRVLASLRQTMRRWLAEHGVSEEEAQDVLVACGEACNNAIEHGSAPGGGWFEIHARHLDGDITLVVKDTGSWRKRRDRSGGRGLIVMEALMDEVDVRQGPGGTEVHMRRRLNGARAAS